jgi:hypothetical protein
MAGGIMQLVAYGVQDVYLTGSPSITFWKVIYKRHTNFAIEPIEQSFSGTADFGKSSVTSLIARNGDLMSRTYLKANVSLTRRSGSGNFAFVSRLGHAMIKEVELQIGGARIDRQLGDWMNVWYELSHTNSKERGYSEMIGDTPELTVMSPNDKSATLFIPLQFYWCRNHGLAIPLIALQYHDVRINFNFQPASQLVVQDHVGSLVVDAHIDDALLIIDYVFLDSEERKRFATSAHEYLIEQLQTPDEDTINEQNKKYRLPFNHPCKEIIWAMKFGKYITGSRFIAYHPTDFEAMQKRLAAALYLASLNFDRQVDGTYLINVCSTSGVYSTQNTEAWDASLQALLAAIENTGVELAVPKATDAQVTANVQPTDAGFVADPFSYISFSGEGWKHVTKALASTTWDDLARMVGSTTASSDIWGLLSAFAIQVYQPSNYGLYIDGSVNPVKEGNIQLNGQDRFTVREGNYFNYVQPYQHHTNTPADGINLYSFALNPEDLQPSGTCNFSRIDFSQLNIKLTDDAKRALGDSSVIYIYTVNYNILRIMGGMGGLAYSNLESTQTTFEGVQMW